ncbi:hypothetical protein [Paenibacillus alginolyticus]|uniref:Uncharacterized protein n=1 Tax=Paenibacillus alginolyticus TaxID=59839 RepID=A0ABT4G9P6_9BACL|nr:hypothetical protein [Paenibacillus alginolyticus]MCY9692915.1 hypothetical protein [Paenibacillus alginolyticus]MEC0144348.1 hypothetical protein [Paenibacillus alginolyticus]
MSPRRLQRGAKGRVAGRGATGLRPGTGRGAASGARRGAGRGALPGTCRSASLGTTDESQVVATIKYRPISTGLPT